MDGFSIIGSTFLYKYRSNEGDDVACRWLRTFGSQLKYSFPCIIIALERTSIEPDIGVGLGVISEGHVVGGFVSQEDLLKNQSLSSDDLELSVPRPWDGNTKDKTIENL
eukprot:Gb_14019 [translate_table: standard]